MSTKAHTLRSTAQRIYRLLERWLGFRCELAGLGLTDGDVLADLAVGRDG